MIEVGKQYIFHAKNKKSVEETEHFIHSDTGETVSVTTLWRNGEFSVTPENEDEVDQLIYFLNNETGFCINEDFSEYEIMGCFDGCSLDFSSEELTEQFENQDDLSYFEWLEENGYLHEDTETWIYGGIELGEY